MSRNSSHPEYLQRVKKIIEENSRNPITAASLAALVGVSQSTLQHDFPAAFGLTVHEYHMELRTDVAKLLLKNPNYTIKSIARQIGYSSSAAFIHAFRKATGQTPNTYRKKNP